MTVEQLLQYAERAERYHRSYVNQLAYDGAQIAREYARLLEALFAALESAEDR